MNKIIFTGIITLLFILIDLYVFQAIKSITELAPALNKKIIFSIYWCITGFSLILFYFSRFAPADNLSIGFRTFITGWLAVNYFSKFLTIIFLFIDDIGRLIRWIIKALSGNKSQNELSNAENTISRSEFMVKASLIAGSVPVVGLTYGILSGAHDYRVRRVSVHLPNLPSAFDGITIGQLSDIHSGSFFNKIAVRGGVEMLLKEKPNVIFFTGDLVNNKASEMETYQPIFEKVKAPMGVFSTLGNHDYGDYTNWESLAAKKQNLKNLITVHQQMGWDLLMDENRDLKIGNDTISIIGVQNWGAKARFPKYGNLQKAVIGTNDNPVKLLLSHDPSHWDGEVLKKIEDIDIMFAGHTHGMQFGVEIGNLKWSPVQYIYEQWAGLYKKNNQYLYVNRGFGYIGFPGRVGILPEITIFTLHKSKP